MSLNTVTLEWQFDDLTQSGLSATLAIAPTEPLYDSTDHEIVAQYPRQVTFSGGAGQMAGIVANDDEQITPADQGYVITVTASNGQVIYSETVQILYGLGAVQWLDSITPAEVVPSEITYIPAPSSPSEGDALVWNGTAWVAQAVSGSGTVTSVTVEDANGFTATVADDTTAPQITLETTVTGLLKGASGAIEEAVAGTDYMPAPSGTPMAGMVPVVQSSDSPQTAWSSAVLMDETGGIIS